jgi:hypothetical protein
MRHVFACSAAEYCRLVLLGDDYKLFFAFEAAVLFLKFSAAMPLQWVRCFSEREVESGAPECPHLKDKGAATGTHILTSPSPECSHLTALA